MTQIKPKRAVGAPFGDTSEALFPVGFSQVPLVDFHVVCRFSVRGIERPFGCDGDGTFIAFNGVCIFSFLEKAATADIPELPDDEQVHLIDCTMGSNADRSKVNVGISGNRG
jgi:hypothetical protein